MAWPLSVILRRVPMAALVIGTLSPDFEYLLRLAPRGEFGHSIAGVVLFCVPVSLTVWALFEKYARAALAPMFPSTISAALSGRRAQRAGSRGAELALAAVGTLVGALSHIAWDSFTHASGWAVLRIPALAVPIDLGSFHGLRVYKLLQHGSTVGGLLVVALWVRKMLDRLPSAAGREDLTQSRRGWRTVAVLAIGSVVGAILNAARVLERGAPQILGYAAVGSMAGILLAAIAIVINSSVRDADSPTRR